VPSAARRAMSERPRRLEVPGRGEFAHWVRHSLRFADLDPLAHLNNVAYAELFESARVAFWEMAGTGPRDRERTVVIARLAIDYLAELGFPGEVDIGTRVHEVGRSSVTLRQGLFQDERCFAASEAVGVVIDRESRRPTPLPDPLRRRLLEFAAGRG